MKKKRRTNHAFSAGFKSFYEGGPEVCEIRDFSVAQQKEYTRGWNAAYFKNKENLVEK